MLSRNFRSQSEPEVVLAAIWIRKVRYAGKVRENDGGMSQSLYLASGHCLAFTLGCRPQTGSRISSLEVVTRTFAVKHWGQWRFRFFGQKISRGQPIWMVFGIIIRLTRYKAKCVKTHCLQKWVGHLEPKFQGEGVVPGEYFLVSTKLDTFCYPTVQTAPCYVPSF